MRDVDLNSDMGESFGAWRSGDDEAMLGIVSSANIACGFHGGDPEVMAESFKIARQKRVAVGAHPGYADLWGFGRRVIPHSAGEIERLVAYQIGAAQALSACAGHPITYVKAHGALGNQTQTDPDVALAVCRAVKAVDPKLGCLTIALGHQERIAQEMGLSTFSEIFADRAYTEEGHLVSRKLPGAVIHDEAEAATRAVRMVRDGAIETVSGKRIETPIHSICVHSDTPQSIRIAAAVRAALEEAGMSVRSFIR
ncbi:LamB/YcsF family protein [Mesorhizobium sp. RP14(2022)]|uniref:5-oxoprolinase subunit A n=1 Tax=Mesorhizobium liriopis TaxID=2953882 RepID=A0ABT1C382_9HYPH|nr:5-oxoprolinase subunit PxpA [Mesorhizobium liriopis]MCO6049287.1 LamB/YcsF family protein [Mesorhizobium liriopis]